MTIEVRCCCDGHLIGWMQGDYQEGRDYHFKVARGTPFNFNDSVLSRVLTETLTFRCLVWKDPTGRAVVALQSRDYPIEQLRAIRQFQEVTNGQADRRDQTEAPGGA